MRLADLGKLLLTVLLLVSLVAAEAAAQSKAKKRDNSKKPDATAKDTGKKDAAKTPEKKPGTAQKTPKPGEEKKAESKPATYKLKKGPFHIEVSLDGVFEAQNQAELVIRPQEWPQLQVLKAVEHGAAVKQGDLVMALDTEKIDRTITELRAEMQLNELGVKQSEAQLAALEKTTPLDADANQRAERMTKEDWKVFREVEMPLAVKENEFRLKMYQEMLEYAQEEYRQLEKMYKADDLKEETEKIVLRRAKNQVDRAKLMLEFAQAQYDETKKLGLPRQEERAKELTDRALIDVEFTKDTLPLLLSKHRLELEKLKVARSQGEDRLNKLISDREAMTVKAPIDGIVYYGRPVRGKWSGGGGEMFRRGMPVPPNEAFMTVVQTRPLIIHTTVPESQAQRVRAGQKVYVDPVGFVGQKLTAIVQKVGTVPMGGGSFDCQMTVAADALNSAIVPGMNCELKIVPYKKTDALTVPPKAVFNDDFDPSKEYVYLVGKGGKPQKRTVSLGERNDKQVEVLSGLAAGDEILTDKPKDD